MTDLKTQVDFLILISEKRKENGYDQKNFTRYHKYLSSQIKTIRSQSVQKKKGGKNLKYKKHQIEAPIDVNEDLALDSKKVSEKISYQTFTMEKAYSTAKELEEQYGRTEEPRKRYHMIRRLAKCIKDGRSLIETFNSIKDDFNLLLASAFVSEIEAETCFKEENWGKALYLFSFSRKVFENIKSSSRSTNKISQVFNTILTANHPIIRFTAYRLNIEGARSDSLDVICQNYFDEYSGDLDFRFGDPQVYLQKLNVLSNQNTKVEADTPHSTQSDDSGILLEDGNIDPGLLKLISTYPEVSDAKEHQSNLVTDLKAKYQNSNQIETVFKNLNDISEFFNPFILKWKSALSSLSQQKSQEVAPVKKYCHYSINSLFVLQNILMAIYTYSVHPYFKKGTESKDSNSNHEFLAIEKLEKITTAYSILDNVEPQSKNTKAEKQPQKDKNPSGIAQIVLFFDNLVYHLKECKKLSTQVFQKFDNSLIEYCLSYSLSIRHLSSAYGLLLPGRKNIDSASNLVEKSKKESLNAESLVLKISSPRSYNGIFGIIFNCSTNKNNGFMNLASLKKISNDIKELSCYINALEKTKQVNELETPVDTSDMIPKMHIIQQKPIIYDLASDFIDFDLGEISKRAQIQTEQVEKSGSKISSLFSSLLGR
ncbi:hypothetical protein BB559_001938 [Furculomyces boomerangus]|uniref:Signal recognition particle subunit SRP68 n=2 Tax=Harpellales TaxID=61421 RepID=A0A2T9YZC0_9FUNG|nr:hypothetical protein BB559_001938 [Furculomyces boomerangus]PWA02791.1 hypothetical protein BB558_001078 [Smittium angustum]